jgi:hypothetical protein
LLVLFSVGIEIEIYPLQKGVLKDTSSPMGYTTPCMLGVYWVSVRRVVEKWVAI